MHLFEFVIAIIVLSFLFQLVNTHMKRKDRQGEQMAERETEQRFSELEERIRVLERIVTDDRSDLNRQFRDLERE